VVMEIERMGKGKGKGKRYLRVIAVAFSFREVTIRVDTVLQAVLEKKSQVSRCRRVGLARWKQDLRVPSRRYQSGHQLDLFADCCLEIRKTECMMTD
jgi:hypothetical protein